MKVFRPGDVVYVLMSNAVVEAATVLRKSGDFYTIRCKGHSGVPDCGIRLRASRLFETAEAAAASKHVNPEPVFLRPGEKRLNLWDL